MQFPVLPFLWFQFVTAASGFGSMGPISAAFGGNGFFCAMDASGKQDVICWGRNGSLISDHFSTIPSMAGLSGGDGFLCGILSNTSLAYCWSLDFTGIDLVPSIYRNTAYSHIAAGKNHVCAIRGSYYSDHNLGIVDCWDIVLTSNNSLSSVQSSLFNDQLIINNVFKDVVSGDGFSCGGVKEGGVVCWGPNSSSLGLSVLSGNYVVLAAGRGSICGIAEVSNLVTCWGDNSSFVGHLIETQFVSLAVGASHYCAIREDNHGVECWGSFNNSSVPKSAGFMAIASEDYTTCGIREGDLVLDCWSVNGSLPSDYDPPLELCSPGLCTPGVCDVGEFAFNASVLNEPELTSLCVRKDLTICSPCGLNCCDGFFLSSLCTANADRVCTACSLCQNSSCWDTCGIQSSRRKHLHELHRLVLVIGLSVSGFLLILICWCLLPNVIAIRKGGMGKSCICQSEVETETDVESFPSLSKVPSIGIAQVFRLSELKDATNGFKEFNELGRGSYGFVYKALLPDGRQVAVKRANAATIIHSNSRDFEMELEILCKIRHRNIVNLLGYCSEMGERLLVYEFMLHGTLHDHLHGGLSPLNWSVRLKIAMQAAKGLEYLHAEAEPPVVHRDIKTSNILLDADWVARIADFGLVTLSESDLTRDIKNDVYNFGIVLLEILTGRKAHDIDYMPPGIIEWAMPLIKQGKAAAIIDRDVALPRNVEPLLKLADIAEQVLRGNTNERPDMSEVASSLEQIMKDGLLL